MMIPRDTHCRRTYQEKSCLLLSASFLCFPLAVPHALDCQTNPSTIPFSSLSPPCSRICNGSLLCVTIGKWPNPLGPQCYRCYGAKSWTGRLSCSSVPLAGQDQALHASIKAPSDPALSTGSTLYPTTLAPELSYRARLLLFALKHPACAHFYALSYPVLFLWEVCFVCVSGLRCSNSRVVKNKGFGEKSTSFPASAS